MPRPEEEPITSDEAREHVKGWEKEREFKKGSKHDQDTVDEPVDKEG